MTAIGPTTVISIIHRVQAGPLCAIITAISATTPTEVSTSSMGTAQRIRPWRTAVTDRPRQGMDTIITEGNKISEMFFGTVTRQQKSPAPRCGAFS
jgi:hypothetical protein